MQHFQRFFDCRRYPLRKKLKQPSVILAPRCYCHADARANTIDIVALRMGPSVWDVAVGQQAQGFHPVRVGGRRIIQKCAGGTYLPLVYGGCSGAMLANYMMCMSICHRFVLGRPRDLPCLIGQSKPKHQRSRVGRTLCKRPNGCAELFQPRRHCR